MYFLVFVFFHFLIGFYVMQKCKRLLDAPNGSDEEAVPKAYSRFSTSCFYEVIQKVLSCPRMILLVKEMGFEFMLQLDDCHIPRAFVQWLADNASSDGSCINLSGVSISLSPESVHDTFSIPAGEIPVGGDEECGKNSFLALFGFTEVPYTRVFADMIINEELSDAMFKRCFMTVTLATVLCPTSSTKPSTKYMGALVDVDLIKDLNWCKFVCDWLQMFIVKYLKDKMKQNRQSITLGGCIYHLAVCFLFLLTPVLSSIFLIVILVSQYLTCVFCIFWDR
jgi:hypothetical protein